MDRATSVLSCGRSGREGGLPGGGEAKGKLPESREKHALELEAGIR